MDFNNFRFILVETSHPGNIGAAARALKTMGFQRLYLVSPLHFPHHQAHEMSAGAEDILASCAIKHSLAEALVGCHLVFATSARSRHIDIPLLTPYASAQFAVSQAQGIEIAIVFGRECAGLTNEELLLAHYHIMIPANPQYSSLNLAQSVQIIAYELRQRLLQEDSTPLKPLTYASNEEIASFYEHLAQVLKQIDFLKPSNAKTLMRLKRLFNRTTLEVSEVNMLRGVLTQVQLSIKSEHEDGK